MNRFGQRNRGAGERRFRAVKVDREERRDTVADRRARFPGHWLGAAEAAAHGPLQVALVSLDGDPRRSALALPGPPHGFPATPSWSPVRRTQPAYRH